MFGAWESEWKETMAPGDFVLRTISCITFKECRFYNQQCTVIVVSLKGIFILRETNGVIYK